MTTLPSDLQAATAHPLSAAEHEAYVDQLRNAQPPILGMTWEQYRDYQSWRIMLQMIAMQFAFYQKATGGEKILWQTRIQETVTRANLQATKFPPQGLPQDLPQPVALDFLAFNTQTEYWLPRIIQEIINEFTNVIVVKIPKIEVT
jgi:hypothetical protein